MNNLFANFFKGLRMLYRKVYHTHPLLPCDKNFESVSDTIYNLLVSDAPCMICRFGSTELSTVHNYLGVINPNPSLWRFIQYKEPCWWWNNNIIETIRDYSGVFPASAEICARFSQLMLEDMKQVDILGSWCKDEAFVIDRMPNAKLVHLICLEPYFAKNPWTRALEGKRVVVVHPFSKQIESQYARHDKLFKDSRVLPSFELRVVQAVQSLGGDNTKFKDWFEALEFMKNEIDKEDYDIALIGCGAYGFPLAAHCKRTGHKAIHLAGALQLLFGIKGNRWDNPHIWESMVGTNGYVNLFNEYWIRPGEFSKPKNFSQVEGACYW